MVSEMVTVCNAQGLHMRPAGKFATEMAKFACDVKLRVGTNEVDGKSLMNIIAAGIRCGTSLEVICDGEGEEAALQAAVSLIRSGFGES